MKKAEQMQVLNRGSFFSPVENLGKGGTERLTCETSELRSVFKSQSHSCNQPLSQSIESETEHCSTQIVREIQFPKIPPQFSILTPTKQQHLRLSHCLLAFPQRRNFFLFYINLVLISSVPISVSLQGTKLSQEAW